MVFTPKGGVVVLSPVKVTYAYALAHWSEFRESRDPLSQLSLPHGSGSGQLVVNGLSSRPASQTCLSSCERRVRPTAEDTIPPV